MNNDKPDYGNNLALAISDKGLKKADFARAMDELPQTINSWIRRAGVPPAKADIAATILGVNAGEISAIKQVIVSSPSSDHLAATQNELYSEDDFVYHSQQKSPYLPLIDLASAINYDNIHTSDERVEYYGAPIDCSPLAFIIELPDSRMDDGSASGYRQGEWVYVDPTQKGSAGDDVLVSIDGIADIGRLSGQNDSLVLEAINPRWPNGIKPVKEEELVGKIIFSGKKR